MEGETARSVRLIIGVVIGAAIGMCVAACGDSTETGRKITSQIIPNQSSAQGAATGIVPEHGSYPRRGLKGDEDDDDVAANHTAVTRHDPDADFDNDLRARQSNTYLDQDDTAILDYGQPAKTTDRKAITALVKRYYAAAAAADGSRVCSLMFSLMAEAIPEDYGRGAGPLFSRGSTCAVVLSKLYRHDHGQVAGQIVVTEVRVKGKRATALIGSRTLPARLIALKREYGVWKIHALFAEPLP